MDKLVYSAGGALFLTALVVLMHSSPEAPWSGPGKAIVHESGAEIDSWSKSFNLVQEMDKSYLEEAFHSSTALGDDFARVDEETEEDNEDEDLDAGDEMSGAVSEEAKEQDEEEEDDFQDLLHPVVAGDGQELDVAIPHKIEHVGSLPSNLGLLGVPAHVEKPKKLTKPKMTAPKAAAAMFVPKFAQENLLSVDDAWKNKKPKKKVKKAAPKKTKKHPAKPPSALEELLGRAKKADNAKKQKRHAQHKFDDLDDAIDTLKKKYVNADKSKSQKEEEKEHQAEMRVNRLRDMLDKFEKGGRSMLSDTKTEANKQASKWLLEDESKAFNRKLLNELIHWHIVAESGGVGKDEITAMVKHANKKHLSQATVVAQVTSANAKAAAFHALKDNTTPATDKKKRFEVANEAVEDVVAASKVLDLKHQTNVVRVAKKKIAKLLNLQLALEERASSTLGHAAVHSGSFCELKWYRTVLGIGCKGHE